MTNVQFWRGEGGDAYTERNALTKTSVDNRRDVWDRAILPSMSHKPASILEVGAGDGANLQALRFLLPSARLLAVEPNAKARAALSGVASVVCDGTASALPFPDRSAELVFTSCVLIHVPPDELLESCREIHRVSSRYIVSIEYFSHEPEMKVYRGEKDRLWKRDFGAFWLDNFPDLHPLRCGFAWKPMTGLDNVTFWVFKRDR